MSFLIGENMTGGYGSVDILHSCTVGVERGEIAVVVGPNGAGKSTAMKAMFGMLALRGGRVIMKGEDITTLKPQERVLRGMGFVPQTQNVFPSMTVEENLEMGAFIRRDDVTETMGQVFDLFPILKDKRHQPAGELSGGQRQQVAVGRALMTRPDVLMLDEPTAGVSPIVMDELFDRIIEIARTGIAILMVEQNAKQSLAIADRGYLLENTRITREDSAAQLRSDPSVQKAFLGANNTTRNQPPPQTFEKQPVEPRFTPGPALPRRSAEQLIGGSIEDLISSASEASTRALTSPSSSSVKQAEKVAQSRLESVLKDIESTAATARRQRPASRPTYAASPLPQPAPHEDGPPPPVVEIYKRPHVEVFRRRPSGQFERE